MPPKKARKPTRAEKATSEATGLAHMFSAQPAAMVAAYTAQVITPVPYIYTDIMIPSAVVASNLPQKLATLRGHVWIPLQIKADGVTLRGAPIGLTLNYLHMICEYVNSSQVPPRNGPNVRPVCGYLSRTFYQQPINEDMTDLTNFYTQGLAELNNAGYTKANFFRTKHIFCPVGIVRPAGAPNAGTHHVFVVVISPMARTVDYLDSGKLDPEEDLMGHFFHLTALHLGRAFDPRDWRMRLQGSTKQAAGSANCGIFYGANIMSIAFGYTLNHAGANILNRRRRMVSEALQGNFAAAGQYHYPLIERRPDRQSTMQNGVSPFTALRIKTVINQLPRTARARYYANGAYARWTRAQLKAHCQANRLKYVDLLTWGDRRGRSVADYREQIELRDLQFDGRWNP